MPFNLTHNWPYLNRNSTHTHIYIQKDYYQLYGEIYNNQIQKNSYIKIIFSTSHLHFQKTDFKQKINKWVYILYYIFNDLNHISPLYFALRLQTLCNKIFYRVENKTKIIFITVFCYFDVIKSCKLLFFDNLYFFKF